MEIGETPYLAPSHCLGFARLILSFALCLANLYEVPLPKCEGNGKDLQTLFQCLPSALLEILSLSCLSHSLHCLSLSCFTSSIFTKLE